VRDGDSRSNLKRRIEEIMAKRIGPRPSVARKLLLAMAGAASLTAPVFTGILNAPAVEAQGSATTAPKFDVVAARRCKTQPGMR
jgi:hypothetical protein